MRTRIIDLLKAMEAAIPPPKNCHHALVFAQYGNDVDGWEDRLALQINNAGVLPTYFLDDQDLDKDPAALAAEVLAMETDRNADTQLAVAIGQFIR